MQNIIAYIKRIYKSRYFWFYLAKSDIRFKYRRSKLGGVWAIIQPLGLTIIMAVVFSTVFKEPLGDYAVYILSGLIGWNLINAAIISGGQCFIGTTQYIRQYNHPKIIYSLKSSLVFMYTFLMELIGLGLWVLLFKPYNILIGIISLPITLLLLFLIVWEVTTIAAYINSQYYDYPQMVGLILQALYYISPVFFKEDMFMANKVLSYIYIYNPVTHILNLIRKPFLEGKMPSLFDYEYVLIMIILLFFCTKIINKKYEKKIIFYL